MSLLFKLFNVIFIIQQVISTTYVPPFTKPGNYTVMIPSESSGVTMSMWGAGGAGTGIDSAGITYPGGSGAFVSCTINALPGSTIYLLVGGGGAVGNFGQRTSSAIGGGGQLLQMLLYTFIICFIIISFPIHKMYVRSRYNF